MPWTVRRPVRGSRARRSTARPRPGRWARHGARRITADFEGGSISSDGGLVLLRAAERRLGLAEALAGCIREWRDPEQGAEALGLEPGKRVSAGAFEKLLQGHVIGTNIRLGRLRDGQHEHRPVRSNSLPSARSSLSPCLPDTLAAWRFARNRRTGSRTVIGERSAAMGYTLGQAATAAGKSKTTILRAIQKSKIYAAKDVHGNWSIDPDELHRVYPAVTEGNGGADDHATTGNGDLRARGAARGSASAPARAGCPDARWPASS